VFDQLLLIAKWLTVCSQHTDMCGAGENLCTHFVAEPVRESERDDQRRDADSDTENRCKRGDACESSFMSRTEVTKS
jgi:hypothetical protein